MGVGAVVRAAVLGGLLVAAKGGAKEAPQARVGTVAEGRTVEVVPSQVAAGGCVEVWAPGATGGVVGAVSLGWRGLALGPGTQAQRQGVGTFVCVASDAAVGRHQVDVSLDDGAQVHVELAVMPPQGGRDGEQD